MQNIYLLFYTQGEESPREREVGSHCCCVSLRGGGGKVGAEKEDDNKDVGFFQYIPSRVGPIVLPNLHIKTHNYYMVKPHRM
jgi:hypothetical protein